MAAMSPITIETLQRRLRRIKKATVFPHWKLQSLLSDNFRKMRNATRT